MPRYFITTVLLIGLIVSLSGCTESPFGAGEIEPANRVMEGQVLLNDNASPDSIYVWLEGFEIGKFTDTQGQFSITIPRAATQPGGGLDAVFKLFCYVDNYGLQSVPIILRRGELVYNAGGLDDDGNLEELVLLEKKLHVRTILTPDEISFDSTDPIDVSIELTAVSDSVLIRYPVTNAGLIGTVYVSSQDESHVRVMDFRDGQTELWVDAEGDTIPAVFRLAGQTLTPGTYEVIPHIEMDHPNLPVELSISLKSDPNLSEIDYLNIPFRRDGGILTVTD